MTKDEMSQFINGFMAGGGMPVDDGYEYRCTKCKYPMDTINIESYGVKRKIFYCKRKECERFGIIVIIGIKMKKSK